MSARTFHPGKLSLYAFLSLSDLFLTYQLVHGSHGEVYESNPVASAWLVHFGWYGLAAFKLLAMSLVAMIAITISVYRPETGGRLLGFACAAVAMVVCYSVCLANTTALRRQPSVEILTPALRTSAGYDRKLLLPPAPTEDDEFERLSAARAVPRGCLHGAFAVSGQGWKLPRPMHRKFVAGSQFN